MVGYLFAGQGSHYRGMGHDLYETFPESKAIFDKADAILGFSLTQLCFSGHPDALKKTVVSQPAIFTVSVAAYEAFKSRASATPAFVAGLSLGEYAALVASGALTFEDGVQLVRKRAQIMEEATVKHPGKMAAVLDLAFERVQDICAKTGAQVANLNAPGQIVISGTADAVTRAKEECVSAGAKRVVELEVSGGFHSSLMREASMELKKAILSTPIIAAAIPVVSNYTALPERHPGEIQDNLIFQMYSSVKWEESMRFLIKEGVASYFEFGPGKVLRGLMRKIDPSVSVASIEKKEDILNLVKGG